MPPLLAQAFVPDNRVFYSIVAYVQVYVPKVCLLFKSDFYQGCILFKTSILVYVSCVMTMT